MENIKVIIQDKLYSDNNRLNPNLYKSAWWDKRNLSNIRKHILENTDFLSDDARWACRIWHIMNDVECIPKCENAECDVDVKWQEKEYQRFCSVKCNNTSEDVIAKREETMMSKYGAKHTLSSEALTQKAKNTCLEKYGVENPAQNSHIQQKMKNTMMKRYGVENPSQSEQIKQKRKHTCLEKYGVEHWLMNPHIREQIKNTCLEQYGVENPNQKHISSSSYRVLNDKDLLLNEVATKSYHTIANELGVASTTVRMKAHEYGIPLKFSSFENEVASYITDELGFDILKNKRTIISNKELDIFIPNKNIAIECNGSYWHAELQGKDKKYHIEKTVLCNDKDIQLLHVWHHDWLQNSELVKSRIKSKLGINDRIYARKTEARSVEASVAKRFLEDNHIQGSCQSSIRYGLYYNDELVALMTFGKARYNKKVEWELLRYCSKQNINIVGGASKLFKNFMNEFSPNSIISYSDKSWNSGNLYKELKFEYSHTTPPAYKYTRDYTVFESRVKYQKHLLSSKLEKFSADKTEWQNMKDNGYDRIWDCGTDVWLWNRTK